MQEEKKKNKASRFLKGLLGFKIALLGAYFFYDRGLIYFAERNARAETAEHSNEAKTEGGKQDAKSENDPAKESKETNEDNALVKKSKAVEVLDSLLNIEKLDTTTLTKDQIGKYMTLIERAKREADDRIEVLKVKTQQLEKMEALIKENIKKLEEEKQYFLSTVQKEKEIKEKRLDTLVTLYGKMEPKKSAPVFEKIDKDLMVALFKKMREKEVTKILEAMSPEAALKATEYFGRVGSAREWDILKQMNQSLLTAFEQCKTIDKSDE